MDRQDILGVWRVARERGEGLKITFEFGEGPHGLVNPRWERVNTPAGWTAAAIASLTDENEKREHWTRTEVSISMGSIAIRTNN